jgi:N-acyl-D-amino-acid deacylase
MHDLVIENGKVIDGSGNPWINIDVGIDGEHIAALGRDLQGRERIDAKGRVVAPGFIDVHTHSDLPLIVDSRAESKIRQGVTTEVLGNCGSSAAPLRSGTLEQTKHQLALYDPALEVDWITMDEYLSRLERDGVAVNCLSLVGHGTIRAAVMGMRRAVPTAEEMSAMKDLIVESMKAGAIGLSTGLIYPPSNYAATEELVELARTAAEYGGLYFTHMRGDGPDAVEEVIRIAREAGIGCQIAHLHGYEENARRIEQARQEGLDITFDQYSYIAGSSGLKALIPSWAHEGGAKALLDRLRDRRQRDKLKDQIEREGLMERPQLTWDKIVVSKVASKSNERFEGLTLQEIASDLGKEPFDTLFDLLMEESADVQMITFGWSEEGVRQVMRSPAGMAGSDGSSLCAEGPLSRGKPHPRNYGNFVRMLSRYVREEKVLSLQEAVRQMTSAPATRIKLWDRGMIRPSMYADIVVFDPERVEDVATFEDPHRYAKGIEYVIVNGRVELSPEGRTPALAGKVLRLGRDI